MNEQNEITVEKTPMPNGLAKESSLLIELLKNGKPGDTITDEKMQEICGKKTCSGGEAYGNLQTAIKYVLNNHGIVWARIRGANMIKCCNATEIGIGVKHTLKSIGRKSKRELKKVATVDIAEIDEKERSEFLATTASLGTIALFTKKDTHKKLETRNIKEPTKLPDVIDMFK